MSPTIQMRIKRFSPLQRIFHVLLMTSFLVQGATGLSRMYIETAWGKWLSILFGGYEMSRTIHVAVGIFMLCCLLLHVIYLMFKINWKQFPHSLFGPDSILPRPRDLLQFFQHLRWLVGLGKAPAFDRWGYWEKFDYWAVFWGMMIIGVTGLWMAYPMASSRVVPGWGLNVAFWVHRIEALLAMAHVFIIHFFIAHLRRHNFPMDQSMFQGSVSLKTVSEEKPAWVARLKQNDDLENALVPEVIAGRRVVFYIFGYAAVAAGVFLLVGALINIPNITW